MNNIIQLSREDLAAELKNLFELWQESIPQQSNEERLLTPEEAQALLSVSHTTLWRLSKTGQLSPISVGGSKRYRQSDINRLMEG